MADIKEKQRAPIKILDKTKIGAERIKDNLLDVKAKDDLSANENGEDYAVNKIEENIKQLSKKGINETNKFGRKSFNETRQNVSTIKDKIVDAYNRNNAKKTVETTKRIYNEIKGTIKTKDSVIKKNKLTKTNVHNIKRTADKTKKAIKTSEKVAKQSKKVAKESAKMAQRIAKATREAAIQTAKAIKVAVKVTIEAIKAIIASTKALISAIVAGGWVAIVIVLIITIIGGGFIAVQNMNNNSGNGEGGGSGTTPGQIYQSSWGTDMVFIAKTQLGNQGGQPYWSWYGFESRVEWCACFVSWVSNQCGYIDKGIITKYSACVTAVDWFNEKHQYMARDSGYIPKCGDIIFFDWKDKETGAQDGRADHTGIVEYTDLQTMRVHTIEGNTSDSVAEREYDATNIEILGYGLPMYQ